MRQGDHEIQVLVHGKRVCEYPHDGETFIEGRTGHQYKLRLVNHSPRRAFFVVSIDGLSIMDGQSANRQQSSGYVVGANKTVDIPGWRLNGTQVAQFIFSELDQSYAHQIGKPANIGVIGCAVFEEKRPLLILNTQLRSPWPGHEPIGPRRRRIGPEPRFRETLGPIGATADQESGLRNVDQLVHRAADELRIEPSADEVHQDVGTGFGQMAEHKVTSVYFNREDQPACVMVIRYMGRGNLESLGINLKTAGKPQVATVDAFPGSITITGCQPPSGWRRI